MFLKYHLILPRKCVKAKVQLLFLVRNCLSCRTFDPSKCNQECNETPTADSPIASCSYIETSELNETWELLNLTLQELDISPLKIHTVASHSKSSWGKWKLKQVECAVSRKIAKALSVDETSLSVKITSSKNKERWKNMIWTA